MYINDNERYQNIKIDIFQIIRNIINKFKLYEIIKFKKNE